MPKLPHWAATLRPHQATAIKEILDAFEAGNKFVIVDAPTGSGKTLIAEYVRQVLSEGKTNLRAVYVCSSIALQDQFIRDFPYAWRLLGRANYSTADNPNITADDCTKGMSKSCLSCTDFVDTHCNWCHPVTACPYEQAKKRAAREPLVCTNTYYFLYEANFSSSLSGRDLIIVDECDTLESILMQVVEFRVSERSIEHFGLSTPAKKTVTAAWIAWAQRALGLIKKQQAVLTQRCKETHSIETIRMLSKANNIRRGLERLLDPEQGLASGGWVYAPTKIEVAFKPVQVAQFAEEYLWRHGQAWLLMSATVIAPSVMMRGLGVER